MLLPLLLLHMCVATMLAEGVHSLQVKILKDADQVGCIRRLVLVLGAHACSDVRFELMEGRV